VQDVLRCFSGVFSCNYDSFLCLKLEKMREFFIEIASHYTVKVNSALNFKGGLDCGYIISPIYCVSQNESVYNGSKQKGETQ
jgi:hypothetical protein